MGQLSTAGKVLNQHLSGGVSSVKKKPSEMAVLESKLMQQRSSFSRLDMKASAFKQPKPEDIHHKIDSTPSGTMTKIQALLPTISILVDSLPDI